MTLTSNDCCETAAPLRLALIGLGGVNRWLFRPAIQQCKAAQLVAGVSPTAQSREAFTANWPVNVYERFDQMVSSETLDGVIIGSPTHLHLEHIRDAAEAGLHVLVTKPLCNTVAECREAIEVARRAGVTLLVGHEFRYRPAIRRMIELARQGDAGVVGGATMLTMHMGYAAGLKEESAESWRMNPQNVPGGCGNLLGVHGIDLANAIFGSPRRVSAALRRFRARLPLEDTTAFTIEYDNALAVITSSYASQALEQACLLGTRGNLIARDNQLFLEANRQSPVAQQLGEAGAAACMIDQFVSALRDGQVPETGGEAGLLAVATLEAGLIAAREGRTVDLNAAGLQAHNRAT